ncbi:hypothetical protein PIB30_083312 [Stylosanthes scabra]|uniref:Uncharacterized protein n=1 Tax=Stylosanthes scabra TaxID=79078 RepID=A0ABU6ZQU9_9FABA|nr:hypothetical protein [Stylosanthes scabra]
MQKSQADYMEEVKQMKEKQEEIWTNNQRFQSQVRQEQERLAKEIQEVRKSQITQTLANNKRLETEKNMQLAIERQGRDIVEMRKQLNLWTRNTSARETYVLWVPQIRLWGKHILPSRSTRAGTVADCTFDSRFPTTTSSS